MKSYINLLPVIFTGLYTNLFLLLQSSALEFKLHQLEFLSIIKKGVEYQTMAVQYARTHFSHFVDRYEKGY